MQTTDLKHQKLAAA